MGLNVQELLDGISVLALKPGDYLAVHIPDTVCSDEVPQFADELRRAWPEVATVFFQGSFRLNVIRGEDDGLQL